MVTIIKLIYVISSKKARFNALEPGFRAFWKVQLVVLLVPLVPSVYLGEC